MSPEAATQEDTKTHPRLAIIFVLYNAYEDMAAFLARQATLPRELDLIIVDNTPHARLDHARLAAFSALPNVRVLVASPENLGYFGAAHFAMSQLPELASYDAVAISNTDLHYDAAKLYRQFLALSDKLDGVGAIAPRLVAMDGSDVAQLHYVSAPKQAHYAKLIRIFASYPLAIAHRLAADVKRALGGGRGAKALPPTLFAPHGAFFLLTRAYFDQTQGFDHPAFLFCEEVFVGAQCRDAALKVIYCPDMVYAHDNHGAMGAIPSRQVIGFLHDAHAAVLPMLKS